VLVLLVVVLWLAVVLRLLLIQYRHNLQCSSSHTYWDVVFPIN
jgi:hypothetical protein